MNYIVYSAVMDFPLSDSCIWLIGILFRPSLAVAGAPSTPVKSPKQGQRFTDPRAVQWGGTLRRE